MKNIVLTIAALMSLGLQANAEGAGRALMPQTMECSVTIPDGTTARLSIFTGGLAIHQANVNGTELTLRHASGKLSIVAQKGNDTKLIVGDISGHGYFHGRDGGMTASCVAN